MAFVVEVDHVYQMPSPSHVANDCGDFRSVLNACFGRLCL